MPSFALRVPLAPRPSTSPEFKGETGKLLMRLSVFTGDNFFLSAMIIAPRCYLAMSVL
jgi:hypothetical protein